ncbi:MAG: hypothetical protein CL499_04760 [Actinobacteria bacterium]|nr:hypothetical protein [Actinomycetota bacterium]
MTSSSKIPDNERRVTWRLSQLLVLGAFFVLVSSFWNSEKSEQTAQVDPPVTSENSTTTAASDAINKPDDARSFTFAASGEILVHEFVADAARSSDGNSWDFMYMFESVQQVLVSADLSICHLETPLSENNSSLSYYPNFEVPYELADAISSAGYDGCSVASNHSLDTGIDGISSTLGHLQDAGIQTAGMRDEDRHSSSLFEVNGITVTHLSVTDTLNGSSLPTRPPWLVSDLDIGRIILDAQGMRSSGAEFVIVSVHWGEEYISDLSDHQQETVKALLDSEHIDLVIGHGTHVPQSVIVHNEKYAVAGLGNFLSNQPGDERRRCSECPPATQDGMILWLEMEENEEGKIVVVQASYYPTWVDRTNYEIVLLDFHESSDISSETLLVSAERTANVVEPLLKRATSLPGD